MTRLEPRISAFRSDCTTNCTTTSALKLTVSLDKTGLLYQCQILYVNKTKVNETKCFLDETLNR